MAIAGLLVQTLPGRQAEALEGIKELDGVSEMGRPSDSFFVAVAEAPSTMLEDIVSSIRSLRNVLQVYINYVHLEDETAS